MRKGLHSKFRKYRYVLSLHLNISKTATGILTKIIQDLHVVVGYNILKICQDPMSVKGTELSYVRKGQILKIRNIL